MAHWELYMSKKNNKKFNKKNHRKNYKIESLEPRFLMDAAPNANDWLNEIQSDDASMQFGVYNISSSDSKMEGLLVYENGTDKDPEALSLSEVITNQKINYTLDVVGIKSYVANTVKALRTAGTSAERDEMTQKKDALDDAQTLLDNASPSDLNYNDLVDAVNDATSEYSAAFLKYLKAYMEFEIDADTLVQKLVKDNKVADWTFTLNDSDPDNHKINVEIKKATEFVDKLTGKQIAPDIAEQTKIGVQFKNFDITKDVSGFTKVCFTLDANEETGPDDWASVGARFNFVQSTEEGKTNANIGILDLKSRADGAFDAARDLTVIGSFTTGSNKNSSISTDFEYDLDFEVKDYSNIDKAVTNFRVDDTTHLKYVGTTENGSLPRWKDVSDDSTFDENQFIPNFSNVQMGDILKQFSAVSKWLQKAVSEALLKNDFDGLIDQNASSFLRLPNYFDSILKTPPKSMQELIQRYNEGIVKVSFDGDVCELSFSSTYIERFQTNASLSVGGFFKRISESLTDISKNSLNLTVDSSIWLCLSIPMTEDGFADESSTLSDIGIDTDKQQSLIGKERFAVAKDALQTVGATVGDIEFCMCVNGVEKTVQNIKDNSALDATWTSSLCDKLGSSYGSKVFTSVQDSNRYMLMANINSKDVESLSVVVKNGDGRCIGINGLQQFSRAYVLQESAVLKILDADGNVIKEIKKSNGGDYLVAINDELMSHSEYADYSAIRIGDPEKGNSRIVIIYSPSDQPALGDDPDANLLDKLSGGDKRWVMISSQLPITLPVNDVVIEVENGSGKKTETIECSKFECCYTVDDVVRVINASISKSLCVEACVRDSKIAFYATDSSVSKVSCSELGFSGSLQTFNAECISLSFDGKSPITVDLSSFYDSHSEPTICEVLDEICLLSNGSAAAQGVTLSRQGLSIVASNATKIELENINGFSLVNLLGLAVDGNSITVKVKNQKDVTIKALSVVTDAVLTSPSYLGSARLGTVGVRVDGDVGIKASKLFALNQPVKEISKIGFDPTEANYYTNYITSSDWKYESVSPNATNAVTVVHEKAMDENEPVVSINGGAILCEASLFNPDNQDELGVFVSEETANSLLTEQKFTDGFLMSDILEQVATALKKDVLKEILWHGDISEPERVTLSADETLNVLNSELPLFGKSAPELLGLTNKLNDVISNISKDQPATLQELCNRLKKGLGVDFYFDIKDSVLDFSFCWINEYKSQPVVINNFSLKESANVGGAAEVYLNGKINALFNFTMSTNEGTLGEPELREDSKIDVDVTLVGNPLSFDLSMMVNQKSAPLLKVVSNDANPSYIAIKIQEIISYNNIATSGSAAAGADPLYGWEIDCDNCQIGGKLRVESAGMDAGEIKIGVKIEKEDAEVLDCWSGNEVDTLRGTFSLYDVVSGKVGIIPPTDVQMEDGLEGDTSVGSVILDMNDVVTEWSQFDLYGQVRLVADALSSALRKAQSSLNKAFLSDGMRKIPLVGDAIVGAADCLTALDASFIEPFRKFAYNSQNMDASMVAERLFTILKKTGLLRELTQTVSGTQQVMWAGSLFTDAYSDNGSQYIQYREGADFAEWRFCLGKDYTLSGNADFDLGMPGLGLSSKGGVGLELSWDWYIGFGVSNNGAYIMLSNGNDDNLLLDITDNTKTYVADGIRNAVETEIDGKTVVQNQLSGDDVRVTMKVMVSKDIALDGSLGFLKMSAGVKDGDGNDLVADAYDKYGRAKLSEFTFGIDLNDGQNDSEQKAQDVSSDIAVDNTKIRTDSIASGLSVETNLEGSLDINIEMTLGFDSDKIDIGFPEIGTTFHLTWEAVFGQPFGKLTRADFNTVTLDLGKFVSETLQPILGKIQKVIDPIMPLIDFLQAKIPVLSSLPKGGSKMTVLNLIKSIGSSNGLELGMIDDIVKVANLVKILGKTNLKSIDLGNLLLDGEDEETKKFLSGTTTLPLANFFGKLDYDDAIKNAALAEASVLQGVFGQKQTSSVTGREYGWFFPIFESVKSDVFQSLCNSTLQLMFGQDVTLVEYRMSPLIFDFDWSKSFPIVGPLCADIGLNFGAQIELSFGYDTRGLVSWKNTGFRDLWALADGFFIDDLDYNGKDISEVVFYSGITAGASIAGRAGIYAGVNINLNLNFDDPNNDGKLRLSELADSLAHSPFAIFDASVTLRARASAYLDLFFCRKEFDLWKSGALELFNTDKKGADTPIVATKQDGNLLVNVGKFAEKRVYGNLDDGNDVVKINCSGETVDITITTVDGKKTTSKYTLTAGKTVNIVSENGVDHIEITGDSSLNFVIEGGNGNDEIDLSGLTLGKGCYALVMGGLGNDFIRGADVGVNILLGETADVLYKTREVDDDKFEYVALVNVYPNTSNPGNNVIVGGRGKNYIVGGTGNDLIVGGVAATIDEMAPDGNVTGKKNVTENHLYGDFAYFEFDELLNLTNAKNEDLYDEGGNDVILGSSGDDTIFGGAGSDHIDGGDGIDEIHGGKGNDVIYGGAGNDKLFGEDGVDVIFGDTPYVEEIVAEETVSEDDDESAVEENTESGASEKIHMVIAQNDGVKGELPYEYISEEIKKGDSSLYSKESGVEKIALFDFVDKYIAETNSIDVEKVKNAADLFKHAVDDLTPKQEAPDDGTAVETAEANETAATTETEEGETEIPPIETIFGSDYIEGGNGSDIIFGDDGRNASKMLANETISGGRDIISGGAGNDFIDGDFGNDVVNGDYGEDILYGGAGDDVLDGGAGNDFVFGDDGLAGYQTLGSSTLYSQIDSTEKELLQQQNATFGFGMSAFVKNFKVKADAKSNGMGGNDTITAGNGSDFIDGQDGDDSYKINVMGGSNHAITNVMDSGLSDKSDSLSIEGTIEDDDFLIRASKKEIGLGFVAKLPSTEKGQIERVNFWKVGGGDTGLENIALNSGAGNDKIALDGTQSTISIDAGAGDDVVTVGQQFESKRTTDEYSNLLPKDVFDTTETSQGYLSAGVNHSTNIEGGEGNDTFNVLHNQAAVSLSGGLGNDTFNVAMFQKINDDGSKSIVENGPVTLIGGAGIDKMSVVGSDGDDDFVISQGRVLSNGIDVQAVSIENKNVYGGDGDDSFYVLDTAEDEVTKLYGNKGNDSFYNGGVGTAEKPIIVSNSKNEDSDAIGVKFFSANATKYTDSTLDTAKNSIDEGASPKTVYKIALTKQPQENEVVSVTIFAPGETSEKLNRGDRGIWLVDSKGRYCKSITYKFGKSASEGVLAWNSLVDVKLVAIGDDVREGNDYFSLLHNVSSTLTNAKIKDCKNALIFLNGQETTETFVQSQYHVLSADEIAKGEINMSLVDTPVAGTIECWYYLPVTASDPQPDSSKQMIASVTANNGNLKISVTPATLETRNNQIFVQYEVKKNTNEVKNLFAVNQEHVLTADEFAAKKIRWDLRALPECKDIDCWYLKDGSPVHVDVSKLNKSKEGGHILEVTVDTTVIPVGTRFFISYKYDHVLVINENIVQMSNSTEGMTELLEFVPFDEVRMQYDDAHASYVCPESMIGTYATIFGGQFETRCRYCYKTAGTQLIICSIQKNGTVYQAGKPVSMYGNFTYGWVPEIGLENAEKHVATTEIQDEKDVFKESSIEDILGQLDADTIENIKGALYEDGMGREADLGIDGPTMLHYSGDETKPDSKDEKNLPDSSRLEILAAEAAAEPFDEGNSKDRIFVNNRKNDKAGTHQNELKAMSEFAKWDESLIAKGVDSAAILQSNQDVINQADSEWLDSDKHSLRFNHKESDSTSTSNFNLANMEYGEINLGTGTDKVDIHKTIFREDGFQTFTVVNTGSAEKETSTGDMPANATFDDQITIHSYAAEERATMATLTGIAKIVTGNESDDAIEYSVAEIAFEEGYDNSVFGVYSEANAIALGKNLSAKHHVFLNVEYTDGTFQRREIDLGQSSATKIVLKRDLTPVADGVEIKTVTLIEKLTGDGMLVVNAQGGDDKIVATNAEEITREDLVVIGGTGADTIDVATNAIAFGDRGQVIYKNEKGEVVTVLGSQDIDVNENDPAKLTEADYTTPSSKTKKLPDGTDGVNTNYFQTDGVVRDAFTIKSMSDTVGGNDKITTHGDKNVAIGGAGSDKIHLNGENNVAVGDNGEVKYVASDSVVDATGNVVEHVYGDSNKTYLHYVQSTSDEFGDSDTITTGDGKNVVIGGTNADTITTGAGNDVIIGDGGEVFVDRDRNPLFVNNDKRNLPVTELNDEGEEVVKNSSGGDTITANDGDNVVFGGLNGDGAVDKISTGSGKDVVFGDNAYATFRGNSSMASDREMENMPTVDAQATLSFNFQGASQTGLNPGDEVGAPEFKTNNWNNISGSIAGTYGNDDAELVRFDNGTRASAVSVSYGGIESHRDTSTDRRINLQAYTLGLHGTSTNRDAKMMNSGLMTTAPNDQCDNQLEVSVDGLAQYFESYQVVVYLDLPDANSWETQSVRKVTLTSGAYSQSFYVNDYAGKNFNGSFVQSHYSSLAMLEADLQYNADLEAQIARGDLDRANAVFKDTSSNYVVFDVPAEFATDRIIVTIEDGIKEANRNGKDIPGIAGIQVKGTFHKQDVAASTDIDYGGNDNIETSGGEDIVVGGTGNDSITTFGDELYGLYDSDVVFGDNAKLTFMDRDNNINTASTLTTAESVAVTNLEASYDDTIDTGDGNDTVVGGIGHDTINAGATAAAEAVRDDVKVLSVNFTSENADESAKIRQATYKIYVPIDDKHPGKEGKDFVYDGAGRKIAIDEHGKKIIETVGETAGVVADNDWHNMYVKNGELHDMEDYSSHYVDGVSVKISTYHKNDHGTWNEYNAGNAAITHENSDELDGDTANSKLYNGYLASQQQYEIKLTLDHIDQFREKNGLAEKAKCDLYVYLGGDNNDTDTYNYLYRISLNNDEVHYLNDWTGHKFDGDYRDATRHPAMALVYGIGVVGDSGVRVELVGNYIVFRDFTGDRASIRILNEYTGGGQSPKNLPVISAVQIVAGEGRQDPRLAVGGDHDKDLVYGDDAKLTFDLDIPFAEDEVLTDYQNRVTEAKSIAIDQTAVTKISTEDIITTGKDRDVVVGGEGKDTITMGDGDDVAVGGSANLIVEHNNPLGVFTPNTEIALDQHTINLNLHQNYLDNDNANEQSFQTRLEQGYIAGVQEVDNTNDRKNEISLGKGRNLHLDGSTNQSALVVEEQQQSTDPGTDPGTTPGTDQPGNDQPGNDQPGTQQGDTLPTALEHDGNSVTLSFNQPSMVNVRAGQTIRLVAYNWDGINSWHPNLVMRANPSNGPFPVMEFSWQGGGQPQQFPSKPGEEWFFEVNIPDAYNEVDEQGRKCLAVYVTAVADTTFMLTLGSSNN